MALHRLRIEQTVYYTVQEPGFPKETPPDLLLVLHGYGQQSEKYIRTFAGLKTRNLLVVAPQAPHQFYMKIHPKIVGCTWLTIFERDQSVDDFFKYMQTLFLQLGEEFVFNHNRIFLLGFSQGVSMAYRLLVAERIPVAGLIACSADIPPDVLPDLPKLNRTPVLITHGNEDSIVSRTEADRAERELARLHFNVEKYIFPGGHSIPVSVAEQIYRWCQKTG
ncbi:MAG: hypothetical protein DWQ05_00165 [Calditrichaeota bacterium]|nr:MAG: hypothetical protein DWQ05_00165 [Calditrichota bacterium]